MALCNTFCPQCGFDVTTDEDGCCVHCGATATGEAVAHALSLITENKRLQQWVKDLQSGMYINCVYCGHRYGPNDEVPASMADVLKAHIEKCPEHPLSHALARLQLHEEIFDHLGITPENREQVCKELQAILDRKELNGEPDAK